METLFGWCAGHGRKDANHDQCRKVFVTNGVEHKCACPNHANDQPVRRVKRRHT